MNTLFLLGLAVFLGTVAGKIFQRFRIPLVVGYIVIGVIIGKSVLHIFQQDVLDSLRLVVNFTLGVIGVIIGAELRNDVFRRFGRMIYTILLGEGLLSFVLVTATVTLLTQKLYLGLLLGAVASATDPASTTNVFWEYRSRGPLTTTVTSVVALDDALALTIYGLASVFSKALITHETFSLINSVVGPLWEILRCLLLGGLAGILVVHSVTRIREKELALAFVLGVIAIVVGLAMSWQLDLILSCMSLGAVVINLVPEKGEKIFFSIKEMSTSLYILFFVVVGAQLDVHIFLQASLAILIIGYLFARSLGKILGAMAGGWLSRAPRAVTRYSGICLFTQGGVAMGLAVSISHHLSHLGAAGAEAGLLIVNVVVATTFVVQLFGPLFVRWGITRSKEAFKNMTREDVIASCRVKDMMQERFTPIKENAPLSEVMKIVRHEEVLRFPVVDDKDELVGSITLKELKEALLNDELNGIILAGDMATPDPQVVFQDQPLKEAVEVMEAGYLDYIPVVKDKGSRTVVGVLEYRALMETVSRRLLENQSLCPA